MKRQNSTWLAHFPIMMFASTMGLGGLTLTYMKAHVALGYPLWIGWGLLGVQTLAMIVVSTCYALKGLYYPQEVAKELGHTVKCTFFAAFSVSLLLLGTAYHHVAPSISLILWYPGAIIQLLFTLHCVSFWIHRPIEISHTSPTWFVPIVGNLIVPLAGAGIVNPHILIFFFTLGIFFWIVLFPILLNRVIFHEQMPEKFMPTIFILLAPPAVGTVSYISIRGQGDFFATGLHDLALFFALLLLRMVRKFYRIRFFISWWAFTFPLAALAISTMLMYQQNHIVAYALLGHIFVALVTVVTALVSWKTWQQIRKGKLFVPE